MKFIVLLMVLIASPAAAAGLTISEPVSVPEGETLVIENQTVVVTGNGGISLEGGTLRITDSQIEAQATPIATDEDFTLVAQRFLSGSGRIEISGVTFSANEPYASAFIDADAISGFVIGSEIIHAHGAIVARDANGLRISGNLIDRTSLTSIYVEGSDIEILNNYITLPGGGIIGDGITIGNSRSVTVRRNSIVAGTCYGIWLRADKAENVTISENTVTYGITAGISVSGKQGEIDAKGITISGNSLIGNAGFGISLKGAATVTGNILSGNAEGFPSQIHIAEGTEADIHSNVEAIKTDPAWAAEMKMGRRNWRPHGPAYQW